MESQYTEPEQPSSHYRTQAHSTCRACGVRIGACDRRLTWRIRGGRDVFEYHYCSDSCLPAESPETPPTNGEPELPSTNAEPEPLSTDGESVPP